MVGALGNIEKAPALVLGAADLERHPEFPKKISPPNLSGLVALEGGAVCYNQV